MGGRVAMAQSSHESHSGGGCRPLVGPQAVCGPGVVAAVSVVADIANMSYAFNRRWAKMAVQIERAPVVASGAEAAAVRELDSLLARMPQGSVCIVGPSGEPIEIPASVCRLLAPMVHELARGNAVTIAPVHAELTTQQAADLLNVSRPFFVHLLESGTIPFHRVGTHRRVRLQDVMAYRHARGPERRTALAEMAREAQELGLYE